MKIKISGVAGLFLLITTPALVEAPKEAETAALYEEGEEKDHLIIDQGTITLGNSNTMRDHIATTSTTVDDFTEALSPHGRLQYGDWSILTEYIAALDSFQPGEALALGLPEHRYLGSVGIGVFDKTTFPWNTRA